MRKSILICLSVAFVLAWMSALCQPIRFGQTDSVYSTLMGEQRTVWVYVPPQESNPAMARKRFPVVYLLDGDNHFSFVTSLVRQFSEGYTHFLPEMIIVGILHEDRMRELTPTHITRTDTYTDSSLFRTTGGGHAFLSFIEKELFPYIDSAYPTAPFRTFVGHSLGGLMVIEAMLKRPQMFNAWLSIDPSLWYDNRKLLRESAGWLKDNRLAGEMFFLAIANNLKPGMDTLRMKKDTSRATNDTRAIFDFVQSLREHPRSGLRWSYRYYGDEDHGSVPLLAEYDGLRYFFRDYRLPAWEYLLDSTVQPDLLLKKQFDRLSASWGFAVHPPEAFVNALAYTLMQQKRMETAMRLFQLNIDAYPGSANAYDSMGDCLLAMGQAERAAASFLKSLEILETPQTRAKLEKIQQAK